MANIVKYETDQGQVELSPEIVKKYLVHGDANKVTAQEIVMFMALCRYQGLNPFLRDAYLIKYSSEPATIVTGKDAFTKRAAKTEDFNGSTAGVIVQKESGTIENRVGTLLLPGEKLVGGWAKVYRKKWEQPVEISVSYGEYEGKKKDGTPNRQWRRMPATMIRKVALVQALREAFPDQFQGMYDVAEIQVDGTDLESGEVRIEETSPPGDDLNKVADEGWEKYEIHKPDEETEAAADKLYDELVALLKVEGLDGEKIKKMKEIMDRPDHRYDVTWLQMAINRVKQEIDKQEAVLAANVKGETIEGSEEIVNE